MAESIIQKSGGGAASDECSAAKAQVLAGYTAVVKDSDDEPGAGTMPNNGAQSGTLNCGQSKIIPAGYTSGGTVTANSLASQTGGVTADDTRVISGYTYWRDGVKRTGILAVSSVVSFSVAPYSTNQVIATWKNPAKGPYGCFVVCAKEGSYPVNPWDGQRYVGLGTNGNLNASNSVTIGGFQAGRTYYFRCYAYVDTSHIGALYSADPPGVVCTTTSSGRVVFTSSQTWTVPAGVRSIDIHCTGGGGCGMVASYSKQFAGGGGGGGYTAYKFGVAVNPGQQLNIIVGIGGKQVAFESHDGLQSEVVGIIKAGGGLGSHTYSGNYYGMNGGSGGGLGFTNSTTNSELFYRRSHGGSNGGDGGDSGGGDGQHVTTSEFGEGKNLYSGGGGGGGGGSSYPGGLGGDGGGGNGSTRGNEKAMDGYYGTGGGGGGVGKPGANYSGTFAGWGGSGNVIIRWGY